MSNHDKQHAIVEHLWRLLRAIFILAGTAVWLFNDSEPKSLIFGLYVCAALVEQCHGIICRFIQKVLRHKQDWNLWD